MFNMNVLLVLCIILNVVDLIVNILKCRTEKNKGINLNKKYFILSCSNGLIDTLFIVYCIILLLVL